MIAPIRADKASIEAIEAGRKPRSNMSTAMWPPMRSQSGHGAEDEDHHGHGDQVLRAIKRLAEGAADHVDQDHAHLEDQPQRANGSGQADQPVRDGSAVRACRPIGPASRPTRRRHRRVRHRLSVTSADGIGEGCASSAVEVDEGVVAGGARGGDGGLGGRVPCLFGALRQAAADGPVKGGLGVGGQAGVGGLVHHHEECETAQRRADGVAAGDLVELEIRQGAGAGEDTVDQAGLQRVIDLVDRHLHRGRAKGGGDFGGCGPGDADLQAGQIGGSVDHLVPHDHDGRAPRSRAPAARCRGTRRQSCSSKASQIAS